MQVKPIKIVILYLCISITWILLGGQLVSLLSSITDLTAEKIETVKGVFFVLLTSYLLLLAIKRQQKFLLHSEKQYKSLFYSNPTPLWIYDRTTLKFLEVNNAAIKIYGYSREEFKKMAILDIRHEQDPRYRASGNWEYVKKNGEIIIAHINSHQIEFNNRACVMVMAQDVTVQIQQDKMLKALYAAEKNLKQELEENIKLIERSLQEKQRLAEVIDRINNIVIITDPLGTITWVNQSFINITGYSFEEAVGKTPNLLHGPKTDPDIQVKIMEAIKKKDFSSFDVLNYTKAGQEYWVEITISAVLNEKNEVVRYISIQNIVTERKIVDETIRQQNRILKKLAWTNSHAIRKPIVSILSLVELSKEIERIEEIKEIHALICVCTKELDDITKEVSKEIDSGV